MKKFVLDTNVLIHALRDEGARDSLAAWQRRMAPFIYQHAVVIAELLAGARDIRTLDRWRARWVSPAERVERVITPAYGTWLRAVRLIALLREKRHLSAGAFRPSFLNDCLLAASASEYGFTIVTHNEADFELIRRVERKLSFVRPFP